MTELTTTLLAELRELALRHRAEGEQLRHLPPALAEAFLRRDVYRLILPRELGGADVGPVEYLRLVEQLARTDGSIAWALSIGAGSGLYGGYLPDARSRALFAEPDCCITGAYAPFGRGEVVDGGYRVSGKWGWASGASQASWMVFGFVVVSPPPTDGSEAGRPEVRQGLAPREAFQVLDTWHVSGLRGTGSTEYEVTDLFVPAESTFRVFLEEPRHPAAIFRMPAVFFAAAVTAVPLGIAQGAIDSLKELAASKRPFPGRPSMRDQASAQYSVAKAEALIESSRSYLFDSIGAIRDRVGSGARVDLELRARARRACVHAAEASAEAVDLCCRAAGGHALFQDQPFERALRDVRAAIAHIVMQPSSMEDAGRAAFGLAPNSPTF